MHLVLKALHFIGLISWFAGLFYLVRLFVYHAEANEKQDPERTILSQQYAIMERRLFHIITWPGMIITLICGIGMIVNNPAIFTGWLHIKLTLVFLLVVYHIWCGRLMKQLALGESKWKSSGFRLWNEVATLLMVAIVFIAVLRNTMDFLYGTFGFIAFAVLLFVAVRVYKKVREA